MKVKFLPQNIELEIEPNQSILDLAQKNGVFIKTVCNGLPSCAECRVKVVEGESHVTPPFTKELNLIGTGHFVDQRRLACQLQCYGDVTIDLSEQVEKEKSGPRRPQGTKKLETEASFAVTGNIIDQEEMVEIDANDTGTESVEVGLNLPKKKSYKSNKPKDSVRTKRQGNLKEQKGKSSPTKKAQAGPSQDKKESSSSATKKKARNRRRNNNRNKNKNTSKP